MAWLATNWPALMASFGMLGIGGVALRFAQLWSNHQKMRLELRGEAREQTDSVALELVETLTARLSALEQAQVLERRYCEAQLSALRHELRNELTFSDALVLAIRHAPGNAIAIIDDALKMREARREAEQRAQLKAIVDEVTILPDAA